ncbi:MAG: hypothetical protein WC139_13780 [Candidatus Kapaibacterium sp.]
MKKLIFLIAFIGLISLNLQAQISVTADKVVHYIYGDTLIKDATFNNTYYVKDFAVNARLTLVIDTMHLATDLPKVRAIVTRSVNNSDFYSVAGDTVTASATAASGHKIATSGLLSDIYANYLKVTVKAIDSTQNTKVGYYLLIDKNE